MKWIKENRRAVIVCAAYFLFALVQSSCMVLGGDDVCWVAIGSPLELFGSQNINGRYLTNTLTWVICHSYIARSIICTVLLSALFMLTVLLLKRRNVSLFATCIFAALANFSLPVIIVQTTINWAAGITNYVTSLIFTFLFLLFCKPVFNGEMLKKSPMWAVYTLIIGFLGAFCVENITAFNVLLALFVIVYCFVRFKKTHPAFFTFLIGASAGTVVMLLNKNYSSIYSDHSDSIGERHFEFSFTEVYSTLFRNIIPYFAKPYFILHIVIAFSLTALFIRKKSSTGKPPKYSRLCLVCVVSFAVYSFFTSFISDFSVLNSNYRIRGIETAFLFLYIVSLLYLGRLVLDGNGFLRFAFYVVGAIIVTAPFLVVNPVTPRCFYAAFIFWLMAAGELALTYIGHRHSVGGKAAERSLVAIVLAFTAMFMFINISNKYIDELRKKYILEQFESNAKTIEIISLPYPEYAVDSYCKNLQSKSGAEFSFGDRYIGYGELTLMYLGVDMPVEEALKLKYVSISTSDYYESKNEE